MKAQHETHLRAPGKAASLGAGFIGQIRSGDHKALAAANLSGGRLTGEAPPALRQRKALTRRDQRISLLSGYLPEVLANLSNQGI